MIGLGFDGTGNLYILDTQAARISVVDPEDNLVRQFIGEGEGPGEFASQFAGGLRLATCGTGGLPSTTRGKSDSLPSMRAASSNARSPWAATRARWPVLGDIRAVPSVEQVLSRTPGRIHVET